MADCIEPCCKAFCNCLKCLVGCECDNVGMLPSGSGNNKNNTDNFAPKHIVC